MAESAHLGSSVERVSQWIEHDIRERGLRVGESYLTAAEIAGLLSVSRATADRAMRQLADRRVLTRRQRAGTFVGPGISGQASAARTLDVVHVLLSTDYIRAGVVAAEVMADTLSTVLEGAAIDMHFIPESDSYNYVNRVIQRIRMANGPREGIVMIRASREAQALVEDSGIPAVVFGTVYPEIRRLPWVDVDHAYAGRVAAEYALELGCKRFALLTSDQWRRGDNLLLEGVTRKLAAAGVKLDELNIISIPQLESVIKHQVLSTIRAADGCVALICRNSVFADCALRSAQEHGYVFEHDFQVISAQAGPGPTPYAHVSSATDGETQIRWLGERLIELAEGKLTARSGEGNTEEEIAHLLIPAVLVPPGESHETLSIGLHQYTQPHRRGR